MSLVPLVILASLAAAPAERPGPVVEQDGIRVEVTIESQVYRYRITNVDADPIDRIELTHWRCYNHAQPPGWEMDASFSEFDTWTDDSTRFLRRGAAVEFSLRAGSGAGALDARPLTLGLAGGGEPLVLMVRSSGERPQSQVWLVVGTLGFIGLAQARLAARGDRRAAART